MCNIDVFLQIPEMIVSLTHAKKRDLLRLRGYFLGENADTTFRTHIILQKALNH